MSHTWKDFLNQLLKSLLDRLVSTDFLIGVVTAIMLAMGKQMWEFFVSLVVKSGDFEISGYWIGLCMLPSYPVPQVEIWRYGRQRGGQTSLLLFAYDYDEEKGTTAISKWKGSAVLRNNAFSGYYYLDKSKSYESGTIALKLEANRLQGVYAQFDPKTAIEGREPLVVSKTEKKQERYEQRSLEDLPRSARARMFFGRNPLRSYAEAKALYLRTFGVEELVPPETLAS